MGKIPFVNEGLELHDKGVSGKARMKGHHVGRKWWVAPMVKCQVMSLKWLEVKWKRRLGPDDERPHVLRT